MGNSKIIKPHTNTHTHTHTYIYIYIIARKSLLIKSGISHLWILSCYHHGNLGVK